MDLLETSRLLQVDLGMWVKMRILTIVFVLLWSASVAADPFEAPRPYSQSRAYMTGETNPYPLPALHSCRSCSVTIEFYTRQLTPDVLQIIKGLWQNQNIRMARGLEIAYFIVLDGHFVSKDLSQNDWPEGLTLRPDLRAVQAKERGVTTYPTFYVKTPNETWLVLPHDIDIALDQIYR
jgi:hypothetical protein